MIRLLRQLAACMLMAWSFATCGEAERGIRPVRATLTEAVYASAMVEPRDQYTVFPAVAGIVAANEIEEGERVEQGEILMRIRGSQAELELDKARLNYEQALRNYTGRETILNELAATINSAELQVSADSLNDARQSRLWARNIGSRVAQETAHLRLRTSRNQLRELRQAYDRRRRELESQLALARTALAQSQLATQDHLIQAEMDGTVYEVLTEAGESVNSQTPLARIGSTEDFILSLSIDEVDIVRVRAGQEVVVVLDAYPGRALDARITRILPHRDASTQTYTAEAAFEEPPERLFEKLAGEANIVVSRREDVLTLPSEYIGPDNTVRAEGGLRSVVTGASNFRLTEIVSGIDTSETVFNQR